MPNYYLILEKNKTRNLRSELFWEMGSDFMWLTIWLFNIAMENHHAINR